MPTKQQKQQAEAKEILRTMLKPGDTVYTILDHVSSSGMSRRIAMFIIRDDQPQRISHLVADALGEKLVEGAVRVSGVGMDMGFHLVYSLSRTLFDTFTCLSDGCPANDHSNDYGDFSRRYDAEHASSDEWWLTASPFSNVALDDEQRSAREAYQQRKTEAWDLLQVDLHSPERTHSDTGYALRQRWL